MSGQVKKIFTVLIVMVACVMIGALVLNVLMPNVTDTIVDALEAMVYNATGMEFDWNGNGNTGSDGGTIFTDTVGGNAQEQEGLGGNHVQGLDQLSEK